MPRTVEKEFLSLAKWYLACRWKVMGHQIENDPYAGDLALEMLGMVDYGAEMMLMGKELALC